MTTFCSSRESEEELIGFLTHINSSHSTIKFTAEWRIHGNLKTAKWCSISSSTIVVVEPLKEGMKDRSVDFLDSTLWIDSDGFIQSDLFVKECAKVTYLLPSSCHAGHVTKNIRYSLGYRLKRLCSKP